MVNNNPSTSYIKKTTEKYRIITKTLTEHYNRLLADQSFAQKMLKDKNTKNDPYARNLLKATNDNLIVTRKALAIDRKENEDAFSRGEILKFW